MVRFQSAYRALSGEADAVQILGNFWGPGFRGDASFETKQNQTVWPYIRRSGSCPICECERYIALRTIYTAKTETNMPIFNILQE